MARLRIKNLNQINTTLRKKITKALRSPTIRKGVGEVVVQDIRKASFGSPSKLYKKWRESNSQYNKLHPSYNLSNINITFTGELLNDLQKNMRVDTTGGGVEFVIEHSEGMHKPYKTKTGKTKSASYQDISAGVSKLYKYLVFPSNTRKNVLKFIRENLSKLIK